MVKSRLIPSDLKHGLVAQLGEHLICIQRVMGSNPISSTTKILTATLLNFILCYKNTNESRYSAVL